MISIYRSARNLGLLTIGMVIGCILAYAIYSQFSFMFAVIVSLLPFLIALLLGVAKTTTA